MKETFLEYLNELIYMLETYEDGWWLKYVQEARQSYFENNRDISYYQKNEKRLAFFSYLLENYVPGNLHEINTAYLKQSQNKSR